MSMRRRDILHSAAVAAATAATVDDAQALQRPPKTMPPDAVGLLYDSTLCIGCKACVAGCKAANGMPVEISPDQQDWNQGTWDTPKSLSGRTLNVILVYRDGAMEQKDRADDGFAFIKRQCLHCIDPSCVSCCPVLAMKKDPETGIVSHDPDRCIGCRYCVYACPFQVPKYELDEPFGRIQKCQLCNHRLPEGKLPGCVESCPTGATLFGRVEDLRREAYRRLTLQPGDRYEYPRGDINGRVGEAVPPHEKVIEAAYLPEVYGDKVLGGTQALYLSAVPFDKLGLPYRNVPDHGYATETEGLQHTLYRWMMTPAVVLGALIYFARRTSAAHHGRTEEKRATRMINTHEHAPIGGRLFTPTFIVLLGIVGIAAIVVLQRLIFGLAAVTHLSDGYPWGIWIAIDLIVGTALGCGGFVTAFLVYILNRGEYHPIIRAALATSLFGYSLGGLAVMFDLGRWWQGYNIMLPWLFNLNSVLLETALCIFCYILVLLVELAPAFLERFGLTESRRQLNRILFIFTGLGVLLPMMHQSSMGTVVILLGYKLSPLWQSQLLTVMFLATAVTMGIGVVIFESVLSSVVFKRPFETRILPGLASIAAATTLAFLLLRVFDLFRLAAWPLAFEGDVKGLFFWVEMLFGVAAVALLMPKGGHGNPRNLFLGSTAVLLNGTIYRLNCYLVGYDPGYGWTYFPSVGEIVVTLGIFSMHVALYLVFVRHLPVLHAVGRT